MGRVEVAEMTQVETDLPMHVPEILLTPQVCWVGLKRVKMHQPAARDCMGLGILHGQAHLLSSSHPMAYLQGPPLMKLGPSKADRAQALCSWLWPSNGAESKANGKTGVSFAVWVLPEAAMTQLPPLMSTFQSPLRSVG